MSAERYRVRVGRDHLVFCCGHFITFEGHRCERLHGHNYRAAVEVEGPLGEDYYLVDFIALRARAKEITDELDHHMLLATKNPLIRVEESPARVRASYRDSEWVFPRGDCILLPIENTTAELIARYIAGRLLEALRERHQFVPEAMRVEVEEMIGVSATYEWRPA
jgi:6-pyruvoyltetrahydropterin/6-carboxytetrahydropterin synthase